MKNQIKKIASILLLISGLSVLLVGCSGGDAGMGAPTNYNNSASIK